MVPSASSPILGFDVGGTKTSVVVGTTDGTVLARVARPSNASAGFESMWTMMVASAEELISLLSRPFGSDVEAALNKGRALFLRKNLKP